MTTQPTDPDTLREQVRARYAAAATNVTSGDCGCGQPADCGCDSGCCGAATAEEPGFGAELYAALDRDQLPDAPFPPGIPTTGKSITWKEAHIFCCAGGRIAEHWGCSTCSASCSSLAPSPPDLAPGAGCHRSPPPWPRPTPNEPFSGSAAEPPADQTRDVLGEDGGIGVATEPGHAWQKRLQGRRPAGG